MTRILYHIIRADFLERVQRYSFLVTLSLAVFLGFLVNSGTIGISLGKYPVEFNSAWVGTMMSLVATFFLSWFGFYLVKNAVQRDERTRRRTDHCDHATWQGGVSCREGTEQLCRPWDHGCHSRCRGSRPPVVLK